ncbi:MAG: porin [Cypionkella sp.]|jgi:outer membrane protein OmpU|nr:porin [Cypionkella sp.]
MKKVLLASTVLAMTATVAAAEVTISGNARMGVVYGANTLNVNTGVLTSHSKLNFSSRVRAEVVMSGETDSGLSFGGAFLINEAGGAANGSLGSVFVSGAFGKIEMGDVDGAAEVVVGNLPEIGYTDLDSFNATGTGGAAPLAALLDNLVGDNEVTFLSDVFGTIAADNPRATYTYSTGGLTFAASLNDGNVGLSGVADVKQYSVGVKYAVDAYAVSLGYEIADIAGAPSAKHLVLGGEATFGTTTVKAVYGDGSGALAGFKQYGLGVTHKMDALTVKAYYKNTDLGGGADVNSYGIGAAYDLGGGATLEGGIADNDIAGTKAVADLGIKFTF